MVKKIQGGICQWWSVQAGISNFEVFNQQGYKLTINCLRTQVCSEKPLWIVTCDVTFILCVISAGQFVQREYGVGQAVLRHLETQKSM